LFPTEEEYSCMTDAYCTWAPSAVLNKPRTRRKKKMNGWWLMIKK